MSNFAFAQIGFRTDLAGEHEVPPIFSESYGSALVDGNDDNLKYQINLTSLDKVQVHSVQRYLQSPDNLVSY